MFLLSCATVLLLDQGSKQLALWRVQRSEQRLSGLINIRIVSNASGWLGVFRNRTALLIFWALTAVGMALVSLENLTSGWATQAALGAAFGGVTGNTVDRIWRGGVIDFVDVRVWPVFNLADAAIVCGVTAALALLI